MPPSDALGGSNSTAGLAVWFAGKCVCVPIFDVPIFENKLPLCAVLLVEAPMTDRAAMLAGWTPGHAPFSGKGACVPQGLRQYVGISCLGFDVGFLGQLERPRSGIIPKRYHQVIIVFIKAS